MISFPLKRRAQPGIQEDFDALPQAVKEKAMQVFVDVSTGDVTGVPLGNLASVGDLADCFKVYFDVDPNVVKPRYRLVYRLLPEGSVEIVAAELVAVGKRAVLDAYVRAARRLGRLVED